MLLASFPSNKKPNHNHNPKLVPQPVEMPRVILSLQLSQNLDLIKLPLIYK